jgi:hypothetical protein
VKARGRLQCAGCRHQASPTAGSILHSSKLPLTVWFQAIYHLTRSKTGVSSLELARRLGVTRTTAWTLKHKLMQVMLERDAEARLAGRVEIDDSTLGGRRSGRKRGRGGPGKVPLIAAVETPAEGRPVRLKLRRVKGFRKTEINQLAKPSLAPGATVVSDGLSCFAAVAAAGRSQQPIRTGSAAQAARPPGQHEPGKPQEQPPRHRPCDPPQTGAPIPRGVRLPLQPTIRSGRDAPPAHARRPQHPTHALQAPQNGGE